MDQLGLDSTILDRSKLDWTELDWAGRDWSALYNSGLDWTEPECKRRELPLSFSVIDHKWCKNVIRTKKLNTSRNRVCHGCPYHILMSSVIYNWTNHDFKLRPRAARTDYWFERREVLWIIASWASSMNLLSTRAYLRLKQSLFVEVHVSYLVSDCK